MHNRGSWWISFVLVVIAVAVLFVFYLKVQSEASQTLFLLLLILTALVGGSLLLWQFFKHAGKLRTKLEEIQSLVGQQSPEALKDRYTEIYSLYMKLSEKEKQNFYGRLMKLRETLEEQLKTEKKVEGLLQNRTSGSPRERQKQYEEVQALLPTLSKATQEKYYSQLVQLKEELERGR